MADELNASPAEGEDLDNVSTLVEEPSDEQLGAEPEQTGDGEGKKDQQRAPLTNEEYQQRQERLNHALREARSQQRQTAREMAELRKHVAELTGSARQFAPENYEIPDPDADPMGAVRAMRKLAMDMATQQREQFERDQQQQQETQEYQQIATEMASYEADFRDQTPDYEDAVKHFAQFNFNRLLAFGHSEAEVREQIRLDNVNTIKYALSRKQDPAAVIYQLAKHAGYMPKTAAARVDQINKAQRNSADVPRGGGKGAGGVVTEEMLLNASDKEYDRLWAQFEKQQTRR